MFDAPFLDVTAIEGVINHVEKNDVQLPIILTHHNLIPQRIPRVAIFPEMLNSGHVRDRIAAIGPPVIYIHGHIHDDPIDVISNPSNFEQVGVVSISAPEISNGYAILNVLLTAEDIPLCASVVNVRRSVNQLVQDTRSILFYERRRVRELLTLQCQALLERLDTMVSVKYEPTKKEFGQDTVDFLECSTFMKVEALFWAVPGSWRITRLA